MLCVRNDTDKLFCFFLCQYNRKRFRRFRIVNSYGQSLMQNFFIEKFKRIEIHINRVSCSAFLNQTVEKFMDICFGNFINFLMAFPEEIMSAMPIENFEILK